MVFLFLSHVRHLNLIFYLVCLTILNCFAFSGHECISKSHFGEFLEMMIDQKLLILSDASFLSSFLIALFIPSQSLLLSEDIVER